MVALEHASGVHADPATQAQPLPLCSADVEMNESELEPAHAVLPLPTAADPVHSACEQPEHAAGVRKYRSTGFAVL